MKEKKARLKVIYEQFELETRELIPEKACTQGCSFCCEMAGSIHVTTLEGLVIREAMGAMPKARKKTLTQAFKKEIRQRESGKSVPCPFLMKNKACMIYNDRPFACRRVYSVHVCSSAKPPMVSRRVMDIGATTIKALQQLDLTGYTGHLSYILYMLSVPAFLKTYESGQFKPQEIMEFGKAHKIAINRMMVDPKSVDKK